MLDANPRSAQQNIIALIEATAKVSSVFLYNFTGAVLVFAFHRATALNAAAIGQVTIHTRKSGNTSTVKSIYRGSYSFSPIGAKSLYKMAARVTNPSEVAETTAIQKPQVAAWSAKGSDFCMELFISENKPHHTASGSNLYTEVISSHNSVNSGECWPRLPPYTGSTVGR
jgi:hypothetical protein